MLNAPSQLLSSLQSLAPHWRLSSPPACLKDHVPDGGHILVTAQGALLFPCHLWDPLHNKLIQTKRQPPAPSGTDTSAVWHRAVRMVLLCLQWLLSKSSQSSGAFPYYMEAQKDKISEYFRNLNKTLHIGTWPIFSRHLKPTKVDF